MMGVIGGMGMIKSIEMNNFKCFKDQTHLEFAPLTILCGVNSSGKSSIIDSLLLLKQSFEDYSVENSLKLNGDYTKCGKFSDISFKGDENNDITLSISYTLTKPGKYNRKKNKIKKSKNDITAFKNLNKLYPKDISKFDISFSITLSKRDGDSSINDNVLSKQNMKILAYVGKDIITSTIEIKQQNNYVYQITLKNIPTGNESEEAFCDKIVLNNSTCYFENFNLINAYSPQIYPEGTQIGGILSNVYLILRMNTLQLKNIYYLTPLRGYPQRNYVFDYDSDDVGLSGELTPYIIKKNNKYLVDGILPPKNNKLIYGSTQVVRFKQVVQDWLTYLGFGKYSIFGEAETVQLKIQDYNISNVGFGISQVLPIIVSGVLKSRGETLLLEQPEIHLHPTSQMAIADYLISMAINEKNVIVETHSDHVINRVVRRMMEDNYVYQKTKIYFVDQDDDGKSTIEEITVDRMRGVISDNENFFTQFASETSQIIQTGYQNSIKG